MDITISCTKKELDKLAFRAFELYVDESNKELSKKLDAETYLDVIFEKAFKSFFGKTNPKVKFSNLPYKDKKEVIFGFYVHLIRYQYSKTLDFYKK